MNYRHAFHAGNFADILKHLTLARILAALKRKDGAFRIIDTHAGAGLYDLSGDEAGRAGEWRDGVARLDDARMSDAAEALADDFRAALADVRRERGASIYPGSPEIARRLMRAQDKLILSEAHIGTADALRGAIGRDRRVKILPQDGWITLNAVIPPPERRGVVLIDPAFEDADEFAVIAKKLPQAVRKWPTGIFALWHPIKDPAIVERFMRAMVEAGVEKMLRAELAVDRPEARGLPACGMLIVNPPFTLHDELEILLPELARLLGRSAARWRNDWLAPERAAVSSAAPGEASGSQVRQGRKVR
ncbi:23S rRNA (adenine(2030)-N(6))-methyltransferase RlmJ [Terrarubrum flagellatum]|uniref:23S rRNA (adenine(2030)-N(6))-methyltransferase RlmJ n=1 Tax=Terrirubrum flagellatum TaxID=2895980 RepID=UPI00314516C0